MDAGFVLKNIKSEYIYGYICIKFISWVPIASDIFSSFSKQIFSFIDGKIFLKPSQIIN